MLADKYLLEAQIGRGGAGVVHRAVQRPMGRRVAVKMLRDDLDAEKRASYRARFLREAALAGRLSHPNVVTVHDFGIHEGNGFLVMEWLQGTSLSRVMKEEGPLEPHRAAHIGVCIARGLRHAHQASLVHRDVKPSNVMLVLDDDGREQAKLMDFGLVKRVEAGDPAITRADQFVGTPKYMAPEQRLGGDVDGRADIFALGVVLYRALTGVLPEEGTDEVQPMRVRAPGVVVPPALEAIVRRAMRDDPSARYADAGAVARDLIAWIHASRGSAEPRRRASRSTLWRLAGVGSLAAAATGLVLAAIGAAGVGAALWMEPAVESSMATVVAAPLAAPLPTIVVDGVSFQRSEAIEALRFLNTASPEALRSAGIYRRGVQVVIEGRPFESLQDFGHTKGIGAKTVQALRGAVENH